MRNQPFAFALTHPKLGDFTPQAPGKACCVHVQECGHVLATLAVVDQLPGVVDLRGGRDSTPASTRYANIVLDKPSEIFDVPTHTLTSVADYLNTSFEDGDREYIDGELLENNVGEIDHSEVQGRIYAWFLSRARKLGLHPLIEVRTQVSPTRYRLPDVTVVKGSPPSGRVITTPPFLVVEVLSPEDRANRMEEKIDDYIRFGVRFIWVIDPKTGKGHTYTAQRRIAVEDGIYRTEDPDIELNFHELFN